MKYTSSILSAASGSVGGLTFSRNKGGSYCRARAVPTNRRSTAQETIRAILGSLANMWATLTDPNRAGWLAYADNVLMVNPLGASHKISALSHFIRSNAIRLKILGFSKVASDAPAVYNIGATPVMSNVSCVNKIDGTPVLTADYLVSDAPAVAEPDSYIVIFASRPKDPTNLSRNGVMNYVGKVAVAALASQPQNFAVDVNLGYDTAGGQRMDYECCVSRADGRYSSRYKGSIIVAPYVP